MLSIRLHNHAFKSNALHSSGLHDPRVSEFPSKPLPTARVVSIQINNASGITDDDLVARVSVVDSLMLMQLGQFVDHDVASTPTPGLYLLCCEILVIFETK